jgi:hypothetical protein
VAWLPIVLLAGFIFSDSMNRPLLLAAAITLTVLAISYVAEETCAVQGGPDHVT